MTGKRATVLAALLGVMVLGGCNTVSAMFDGVGGVFMGAGQDVRSVGGR
jgi:predicted small secreted protein